MLNAERIIRTLAAVFCAAFIMLLLPAGAKAETHSDVFGTENALTWEYDDETFRLVIRGAGAIPSINNSSLSPWLVYREDIQSLVLEEGITGIGNTAFRFCSSLTFVIFGKDVNNIGTGAFTDCTSLQTLVFKTVSTPNFGTTCFEADIAETIKVYYPEGQKDAYQTALQTGGLNITLTDDNSATVDITPPSIQSIEPVSSAALSGHIEIIFDEPIAGTGTVSLDNGIGELSAAEGEWISDQKYRIPYSSLAYETTYTVTIEGFYDTTVNLMEPATRSFTTLPAPRYAVAYDLNGGSSDTPPAEPDKKGDEVFAAAGAEGITPPHVLKRFKEWNTSANGSGTGYNAGANITMPHGSLTLFAVWEDKPLTPFPVTYHLNGGSGTAPTESNQTETQPVTVKSAEGMTPPDYMRFKEWNSQADGLGTSYHIGETVPMPDGALNFYAVWEYITYTVSYDLNGGTGTTPAETPKHETESFNAAASAGLTAPQYKRFKQWNTSANGSGTGYGAGLNINMPGENLTLYAVWEYITYTVTYDLNGGTGTTPAETPKHETESFTAAASAGLTAPQYKRFKQWNTSANGSGTGYGAGLNINMPGENLTLYAVWEYITYTVTYELNGGTGSVPTPVDRREGDSFRAADTGGFTPPADMRFKGWNTKPNADGDFYAARSNIIMPGENLTLYAIWTAPPAITFSVIYDLNGGSGATPVEAVQGEGAIFAAAGAEGITAPEHKQFSSWNTSSDGTGTAYLPADTVTMPGANLTLYAIWQDIAFPVTYDLNGGFGDAPLEGHKPEGATFPAAANEGFFAPDRMRFKTWNTAMDGGGVSYLPGETVTMPGAALTLYAIWEDMTYPVYYDLNGGFGTEPTETAKKEGESFLAAGLKGIDPPSGKRFKNWNTLSDNNGTPYNPGETIVMRAGAFRLYAIWEDMPIAAPSTYTVSALAGAGGIISPAGKITVFSGDIRVFTITPDEGYEISSLLVDGVSEPVNAEGDSYTLNDIAESHNISAIFAPVSGAVVPVPPDSGIVPDPDPNPDPDSDPNPGAAPEPNQDPPAYSVLIPFGEVTESGEYRAVIDAPLEQFVRLTLLGEPVSPDNYTVSAGSTIILLKESYLASLPPGEYIFRAEFSLGTADLPLVVSDASSPPSGGTVTPPAPGDNPNPPKTDDEGGLEFWQALMLAAILALAANEAWRRLEWEKNIRYRLRRRRR